MDITWLGHACFRLKGSGLTVVTDPFDDSQPFTPGPIQADAVTVSNPGPSHSSMSRVQGSAKPFEPRGSMSSRAYSSLESGPSSIHQKERSAGSTQCSV